MPAMFYSWGLTCGSRQLELALGSYKLLSPEKLLTMHLLHPLPENELPPALTHPHCVQGAGGAALTALEFTVSSMSK